jgi:hypothetical protein
MRAFEVIALSPQEARLLTEALRHRSWRGPYLRSARDELVGALDRHVGPGAAGQRLDLDCGVEDWPAVVLNASALTDRQAEVVLAAVEGYWATGSAAPTQERLSEVGLI